MPKFLTEIEFQSTGSMDTPDPNSIIVYKNDNGHLYAKFPNGTQFKLSKNLG
jgi:hypothetical protein